MGYPRNYGLKPSPRKRLPVRACAEAARPREVQMSICLRRREFIAGLGGAAAWPLAARAQQPKMPVIGYLSGGNSGSYALPEFHQGLSQAGYVEGRNVAIEYHWAGLQFNQLPALAEDLVRRQVSVIVANGFPATLAAKATTAIPIVFTVGVDPVRVGLIDRLNRPGGNLTGVTSLAQELEGKRLEMLHEAVPAVTSIVALFDPAEPAGGNPVNAINYQLAARALGLQPHILFERNIDLIAARLTELRAGALVFGAGGFTNSLRAQLIALAQSQALPTIGAGRDWALNGALMSYGNAGREAPRILGFYAGRVLKGEKPADLPVQQITRVQLVINMKTAKALGITIPTALLVRADEVIE
jgi:putative ABC transport system substrate-binding protein